MCLNPWSGALHIDSQWLISSTVDRERLHMWSITLITWYLTLITWHVTLIDWTEVIGKKSITKEKSFPPASFSSLRREAEMDNLGGNGSSRDVQGSFSPHCSHGNHPKAA